MEGGSGVAASKSEDVAGGSESKERWSRRSERVTLRFRVLGQGIPRERIDATKRRESGGVVNRGDLPDGTRDILGIWIGVDMYPAIAPASWPLTGKQSKVTIWSKAEYYSRRRRLTWCTQRDFSGKANRYGRR